MLAKFYFPRDIAALEERLPTGLEANPKAAEAASAIIRGVRERGDAAVAEFTARFDGVELSPDRFRVSPDELRKAWDDQPAEIKAALEFARDRIERYHRAQLPKDIRIEEEDGSVLRRVYKPLQRVGVYVPGGSAAYPSTVLMNIVPAQVAGVNEIVMVTPPEKESVAGVSTTFAVAHLLGVKEVYRIGGAQAVAALALGTETIRRVDKIVGPGNAFVNEAKRLLYGQIDIDSLAGPSEILAIIDETSNPEYVAADLLSQAEHSPDAQAVVVVLGGEAVLGPIEAQVERQTNVAPRKEIILESLATFGTAILVDDVDQAVAAAEWKAPEHLQILTKDAEAIADRIRCSGAIFVGENTPEAVCDYAAGPNHVLPTGGTARYFSGLNTSAFLRGANVTKMSRAGLEKCLPHVRALAETEGLHAHAAAIAARFGEAPFQK